MTVPGTSSPVLQPDFTLSATGIGSSHFHDVIPTESIRPKISVALPQSTAGPFAMLPFQSNAVRRADATARSRVSWSLEAWQMNTASLAHIRCSSASQTLETLIAQDCRFVDQPAPASAMNLFQVEGQWLAAPGLQLGLGAFTGQQPIMSSTTDPFGSAAASLPTRPIAALNDVVDQVDGVSMNLSFGLQAGRIGDLILDLELSRYRRSPESFALRSGLFDAPAELGVNPLNTMESQYQTAGQLGLGWRRNQFSADLVGQYQELPYWFGSEVGGEGFNSFDIEFSWRAPVNTSISVGISNVLDSRPEAANSVDQAMHDSIDSIYGRIPYVRFKHDL
mgnify:CR=1 FL=1